MNEGDHLMNIRLSPPLQITWIIALVLAVLGVIGKIGTVAVLTEYAFWLVLAAAALLLLACIVKGL
jgi:hypothetical protein